MESAKTLVCRHFQEKDHIFIFPDSTGIVKFTVILTKILLLGLLHTATIVEILDHYFPNKWIRRNAPTLWLPRSPDLTPRDFLHEERFYLPTPAGEDDITDRIHEAIADK